METQTEVMQSSTPTSEAPAPQPVSTASDSGGKAAETAAPDTSSTPVVGQDGQPVVAPPAYTPNYKFKSFDKEYEMDEFVRAAIKTKEDEAKLRSVYEKAYGLDVIKPRYQDVRENYQKLQTEHKTLTENIGMLEGYLNQGNMEDFFKTLQIPDQLVYKYVLDKLNYNEAPPEQRRQLDAFRENQQKAMIYERENARIKEQYEREAVQLRSLQLDSVLARPDISSIVNSFESRKGKPGIFKERVIREGISHYQATGEDLPPEEAVRRVLEWLDLQPSQAEVAQAPQAAAAPQAPMKPPVIPNIAGKGASPAKKQIKSIEDLKKRAAELSV